MAQRCLRRVALGDVVAFAEYAGDLAGLVEHGLIDEVEETLDFRSPWSQPQPDRHVVRGMAPARGVDLCEPFEESLALEFRERVPGGLADVVAVAEQLDVGVVDELEDVARLPQDGDEARRLLEEPPLAIRLLLQSGFRQHLGGGLGAGAEHSRDMAAFVPDRRIGEGEPGLLLESAAVHEQRQVLLVGALPLQGGLHERRDVGPDLRPDLAKAGPQGVRVLRAEDLGIGIVVEEAELVAPGHEHGKLRRQHQPRNGTQGLRPGLRRAERGGGPVLSPDQRGHAAAALEEGQGVGQGRPRPVAD